MVVFQERMVQDSGPSPNLYLTTIFLPLIYEKHRQNLWPDGWFRNEREKPFRNRKEKKR